MSQRRLFAKVAPDPRSVKVDAGVYDLVAVVSRPGTGGVGALLAVASLCAFTFTACGGGASRTQSTISHASATPKSVAPPKTVRASLLGSMPGSRPLPTGTRVRNSFSGVRNFATRRDGFALGNLTASEGGAMYPLATTDGGKTWRIAGPIVDVPAAQGGVDVGQGGIVDARTWFMCCGLNTVVDVTTDAGKHWWAAFLPGEVVDVFGYDNPHARLIALVRPFPTAHSRQRLRVYTSVDGRRWSYDPSLNVEGSDQAPVGSRGVAR